MRDGIGLRSHVEGKRAAADGEGQSGVDGGATEGGDASASSSLRPRGTRHSAVAVSPAFFRLAHLLRLLATAHAVSTYTYALYSYWACSVLTADVDMGIPSVRLSVCLSVTLWYCITTVVNIIKLFPSPGEPVSSKFSNRNRHLGIPMVIQVTQVENKKCDSWIAITSASRKR